MDKERLKWTRLKGFLLVLVIIELLLLTGCGKRDLDETPKEIVDLGNVQRPDIQENGTYYALEDLDLNIGIYLNSLDEIDALEEMPQVIAWFEDWMGTKSRSKIEEVGMNHIAIPFITWQPTAIPLIEIIDGKYDEYITGYFTSLAIMCPKNDVLIRFAHEMEMRPVYKDNNWYSWQEEDAELYKKAWIHLVEIGRKINKNIKWVWSPNRSDVYSEPYYPGDEYVDYVGVTLNLPLGKSGKYADFGTYYENEGTKKHLEQYGKKIIISEVAFANKDELVRASYIKTALEYAFEDPNICLISFFNEDKGDGKQYQITDDPNCMQVIYEGIRRINEKE